MSAVGHKQMRQVEVHLKNWAMADALAELRIWLDHNHCAPLDFEITKMPNGGVRVRVEFVEDEKAEAFERGFGR